MQQFTNYLKVFAKEELQQMPAEAMVKDNKNGADGAAAAAVVAPVSASAPAPAAASSAAVFFSLLFCDICAPMIRCALPPFTVATISCPISGLSFPLVVEQEQCGGGQSRVGHPLA